MIAGLAELRQAIVAEIHRSHDGNANRSTPAEATAASLEVYEEGVKRENEACKMLIEVERLESMMRDVLVQQVLATAFKLRKNGIVSIPAIAWDGSLGPEEQRIINRVGFLVNAYSVQTWYWEVSLSPPLLPSVSLSLHHPANVVSRNIRVFPSHSSCCRSVFRAARSSFPL